MTTSGRMRAILAHYQMSATEFATRIKVRTGQAIYDLLSGKTKSISHSMEDKILSCFPEINRTWLLTGEGEMINDSNVQTTEDNSPNTNSNVNHVHTSELLDKALNVIAELRKLNQELVRNNQTQFERFMAIIEKLTEK